jgi:hypothetical protein
MQIKIYVRIIFWVSFVVFILNKRYLRPWIAKSNLPEAFSIITYSLPNFIEAILGTILVTGIVFQIRKHLNSNAKDNIIYIISVLLTSIYVISQELKYHNLGGNNVYDPNDLIASILGLIAMLVMFYFFGFIVKSKAMHFKK